MFRVYCMYSKTFHNSTWATISCLYVGFGGQVHGNIVLAYTFIILLLTANKISIDKFIDSSNYHNVQTWIPYCFSCEYMAMPSFHHCWRFMVLVCLWWFVKNGLSSYRWNKIRYGNVFASISLVQIFREPFYMLPHFHPQQI